MGACEKKGGSGALPDLSNPIHIAIEIAEYGTIEADLYPNVAPITVSHIVSLIEEGFYDNLTFHRVIANFVIQGGDPTGTGRGDSSQEKIKGEFSENGVVNNLSNTRGTLAMARTDQSMDSATSQFFINLADNTHLDGKYATFGMVTSGMEVADSISKISTDSQGFPEKTVVINSIRIVNG